MIIEHSIEVEITQCSAIINDAYMLLESYDQAVYATYIWDPIAECLVLDKLWFNKREFKPTEPFYSGFRTEAEKKSFREHIERSFFEEHPEVLAQLKKNNQI